MAAISSCVELIAERLQAHTAKGTFITNCLEETETIQFCLQHMTRLVEETLTLSKIENDYRTMHLEAFSPLSMINKTLRLYEADIKAKDITCSVVVGPMLSAYDDLWLVSDPSKLIQIIINFLSNAIKFTAECPKREITVTADVSTVKPTVHHSRAGSEADQDTSEPVFETCDSLLDHKDAETLYLSISVKGMYLLKRCLI